MSQRHGHKTESQVAESTTGKKGIRKSQGVFALPVTVLHANAQRKREREKEKKEKKRKRKREREKEKEKKRKRKRERDKRMTRG